LRSARQHVHFLRAGPRDRQIHYQYRMDVTTLPLRLPFLFFPTGVFVVYTGPEGLGGLYDLLEVIPNIQLCSRRFHRKIGIPCPRNEIDFIAIYWASTKIT